MAKLFPHVYVLGVDAAPSRLDPALIPLNVCFELDNVDDGLRHYHGNDQFDLIHMRMVQSGVADIQALLIDLQACLRPGGLLIVIDMMPELYDQHRNIVPMAKLSTDDDEGAVSQTGSWLARFLFGMHLFAITSLTSHNITEVNDASQHAGVDMALGNALIDIGFWDEEHLDPSTAMSGSIYLPVGSWGSCTKNRDHLQALKEVGSLMQEAFMGICDAHVPWLRHRGLSTQMLDEWEQNIARGMWPCGSCYACNKITIFQQRSVMRNGIT
jgi:SAM-dependent methyltransferase